ncbi:hypothetical protein A7U60_g4750 [Sanghuangporus baumii]|uniref:Uncharacterized protein n=1 Tax=Sanghuangporus baumii TaxID=108892 RepID=A0A9Q5HY16_SANBA|nr:hypothetical protein A7U60_g4750 [Sanghuangporus baumii]
MSVSASSHHLCRTPLLLPAMHTQHRSNTSTSESEDEHRYPPGRAAQTPNYKPKSRFRFRIRKLFVAHRRRRTIQTSETQSHETCEFSSTAPSMTTSRSLSSSPVRSLRRFKPRFRRPAPPVIVPSWRYKAEPQTFTVRVETEFTVTCTVIQPKSRFRFGWPGFCMPRHRSQAGNGDRKTQNQKKKRRRSRWGVAIERDVCDDAAEIIEPRQQELESKPHPRTRTNVQTIHEKRARAIRRSSGWAGVFSASESNQSTSASGSARSSHDQEQAGFTIDRTSRMLVVPGVDVGIARVVKHEVEKIGPTVRLVRPAPASQQRELHEDSDGEIRGHYTFTSDSDDSWLELE